MKIINSTHLQIISDLDKLADRKYDIKQRVWVSHYLGSNKPTRCIRTGDIKDLAKKYQGDIELINSLYENGTTFDELAVAAAMVGLNKVTDIDSIDKWLNYTFGWAEIDSLCQSNFHAVTVLADWLSWKKFLIKLSDDININKRRASLVLLCKSLGESDDSRIFDFAINQIEKLKFEKEILITKAISWVLRQMVRHHPDELAVYLEDNKESLPRIAYREAFKKLTTGRKN